MGIANYIQRVRCFLLGHALRIRPPLTRQHFDWAENNLFVEEISGASDSSRMAVFLGAQDIIVDAVRARRYLEKRASIARGSVHTALTLIDGVKGGIHWDERGGHGDGLSGASLDRVIKFVSKGSVAG